MDNYGRDRDVLDRFEARARSADLVCFDLFDTLVIRPFAKPTDLFSAMRGALPPGIDAAAADFSTLRIEAERAARADAHRRGRREVTHKDIYTAFGAATGAADEVLAEIMALERRFELAAARADPQVIAVYRRLVDAGRRVVLVSDMYLPRALIDDMLQRIGIAGFEGLYLSSETDARKADGSVWPLIRADFDMAEDAAIVHLGDNPDSDGRAARAAGIDAFLLAAPHERPDRSPRLRPGGSHWLPASFAALAGQQRIDDGDAEAAYWRRLGYGIVAPAALAMAAFSLAAARRFGAERVHFLARDGLVFKRAYDILFAGADAPPSHYLWASRRCLNLAGMAELGDADLDFLVSGLTPLHVHEYLARIGLDPGRDDVHAAVTQYFDGGDRTVANGHEDGNLRRLFRDLQPQIRAIADAERAPLLRHLDEAGIMSARSLVVDIGWHGTMQRALIGLTRHHAGIDPALGGAYFGTFRRAGETIDGIALDTEGFLFDRGAPQNIVGLIRECVEIPELLFSAPEPGISRIDEVDGELVPIRTPAGADEARRMAIATIFHDCVVDCAAALAGLVTEDDLLGLKDVVIARLDALLRRPGADDLRHIGEMPHADSFGGCRYRPLVPSTERLAWGGLLPTYRTAYWKRGFRARLKRRQRLGLALEDAVSRWR